MSTRKPLQRLLAEATARNPLLDLIQTLNIRALHRRVSALHSLVTDQAGRITTLEERMATTDQLVARLRTVTDTLAAKLRRLSEGDPRFEPIIAELEAMGVDEADPLPDPAPEPPA